MVREVGDCDDTNPDANDTTNDNDQHAIISELDCDDTNAELDYKK